MVIIFSAPSGSGKTTLVKHILENREDVGFSISVTTRELRGEEKDGVDYYFVGKEEFETLIDEGKLIEYQEVYPGKYYGTLYSEIERLEAEGKHVIFDMDVFGGRNLRRILGKEKALSIFVSPPDLETLEERLRARGTDSPESIFQRLEKTQEEMELMSDFDIVIVNKDLEEAKKTALEVVNGFLLCSSK